MENNKNYVLLKYVYIKTERLIFTFSFIGNFGCIFRFWFPEGIQQCLQKFFVVIVAGGGVGGVGRVGECRRY